MGNKAILMSIKPKWNVLILNDIKKIEVRSKFCYKWAVEQIEKFGGFWIYDYCTKGKTLGSIIKINSEETSKLLKKPIGTICGINKGFENEKDYNLKGKVVARFWCDKVEEIKVYNVIEVNVYKTDEICAMDLCKKSCLTQASFERYLGDKNGYAIYISKLEVFDKAKELKEFRHTCKAEYRGYNRWQPCSKECKNCVCNQLDDEGYSQCFSRLTKAPQSYMFVEVS